MTGTLTDNDIAVICGVIFFMVCFYFFYQKLNLITYKAAKKTA
jgi:hypothetical protein